MIAGCSAMVLALRDGWTLHQLETHDFVRLVREESWQQYIGRIIDTRQWDLDSSQWIRDPAAARATLD